MKKRILTVILAAAMLLIGATDQALAYFLEPPPGALIRVVYNLSGNFEILTDLGAGYNYTSPSTQNTLFNQNNFNLNELGIADWSSVYVAYFAMTTFNPNFPTEDGFWLSGSNDSLSIDRGRFWNSASAATVNVQKGAYAYGTPHVVQSQTDMLAYSRLVGQIGDYYCSYVDTPTVHKNLSSFAAEGDQYVDQYLYYFSTPNVVSSGLQVATIRTYENGSTEINPVPVPAAIYLLGSGLLALVGIRRKAQMEG